MITLTIGLPNRRNRLEMEDTLYSTTILGYVNKMQNFRLKIVPNSKIIDFQPKKTFNCLESITFTTHGEFHFMENLIPLLKRWQGTFRYRECK